MAVPAIVSFTPNNAQDYVNITFANNGTGPFFGVPVFVGRLGIDKGQIPKKFQMHWPENGINNVSITWWDFKALVLYNIFPGFKKELKELCTQLGIEKKGKLHNPKIRERAFEDIKSGKALDLFQAIRVGGFVQEVEANEEDDSDEYALDLEDE
jgi:hypothetical protein